MTRTHYPDVKTARCDACLGAGCYTCRHDGHIAFCAGCGDAVDTELPDVAYDAQIEYLGTHGGFCAGCVGELERADTAPADTAPPVLDHESSGRMFPDDVKSETEFAASYDASPKTAGAS